MRRRSTPAGRNRCQGVYVNGGIYGVGSEALPGDWYAHRNVCRAPWEPRTTLLSPFDNLIADRRRAESLLGFRFRTELYSPAAERRGYFVMPILHGDRLIGRVDPRLDRRSRVLRIQAIAAESEAPGEAGPAVADALRRLASWLGAELDVSGDVPGPWAGAFR